MSMSCPMGDSPEPVPSLWSHGGHQDLWIPCLWWHPAAPCPCSSAGMSLPRAQLGISLSFLCLSFPRAPPALGGDSGASLLPPLGAPGDSLVRALSLKRQPGVWELLVGLCQGQGPLWLCSPCQGSATGLGWPWGQHPPCPCRAHPTSKILPGASRTKLTLSAGLGFGPTTPGLAQAEALGHEGLWIPKPQNWGRREKPAGRGIPEVPDARDAGGAEAGRRRCTNLALLRHLGHTKFPSRPRGVPTAGPQQPPPPPAWGLSTRSPGPGVTSTSFFPACCL